MHVALVTYDNSVHFYALRAEQSAFQMLVVPDAQQPYCPAAASSLIVPLQESRGLVRHSACGVCHTVTPPTQKCILHP